MRLVLSVFIVLLVLPMVLVTHLNAGDVRRVYPEQPIIGNEPAPFSRDGWTGKDIPSPPKLFAVGTIVDSTIYDYQGNGSYGRHIVAIGDSSLHATVMVSPDPNPWPTRGMKYIYYANNLFTNFGYIEGSGTGDERAGFGSITSYYVPEVGLGNVAISCSHTNLDGRAFGSHFYSFTDAFQGVGAFTPAEGDPGSGTDVCDAFLWPTLTVMNDITGSMAMAGLTGNVVCGTGADEIGVVQKNFTDTDWGTLTRLDTMDDPSRWSGPGPNIPLLEGSNNGRMVISSAEFGTNVYYWESTDGGVTWGDRQDVTGFPIIPHNLPPDSNSTEYRPLQNGSVAMSRDGTPHIFWTAYQARGTSISDSTYTPGVSNVWQYRTKLEHWDPINGITTVYRHPVGLADQVQGTLFAYNVGHPTIGFGPTDDIIYVVYEGFVDSDVDPTNGFGFGDIYVSMSTDGGATWEDRINITNTTGDDDLFPAIARYNEQGAFSELPGFTTAGGDGVNDFVLIYQNDDIAGTYLNAEETSPNWDMLLVAPVDFAEIEVAGIGDGGADQGGGIPKAFALGQNYPNPFNPSTSITYQLAERSDVTLKIHNVRGQLVRELVRGVRDAGTHTVQWNGRDASGQTVSSGIYLYVLETDKNFRSTRKMVVLK